MSAVIAQAKHLSSHFRQGGNGGKNGAKRKNTEEENAEKRKPSKLFPKELS